MSAAAPAVDEVRRARAFLARVAEPPAPALAALVARVGPVEAADLVRRGDVLDGVAAETAARRVVELAARDLAAAAAAGARLVVPEDAEWPAEEFAAFTASGIADLAPPVALWVRGPARLDEVAACAVAVVGARAATAYGVHVAAEVAAGVVEGGRAVVSGAAIGIDGAAHRGALAVDGTTVAVLACGVDRAYPAAHEGLIGRIAATGAVVSEYPPGAVPARNRFLVRNRLIAGLAAGTVVVEAGLRSGAQRTATDAVHLGRALAAVPGPVTSATSAGCHRLLRDGAELVTSAAEVLEAVGRIGVDLAPEPAPGPVRPTDLLSRVGRLVHDALPARAARDATWIAVEAGIPAPAVRGALTELERRGLVEHWDGRWQRRAGR